MFHRGFLPKISPFLVMSVLAVLPACVSGSGSLQASRTLTEQTVSTAKEAYPLAERVARDWRPDAELRSVRTTFQNPSPSQLREGRTTWAYLFVSPSGAKGDKLSGYIVSVSDGKAEGSKEGLFSVGAQPFIFVDWKFDSSQALKVFLENGGQDFLASHAQADIYAILRAGGESEGPLWEVTAFDRETKSALGLQVDASTGAITRRG